METFIGSFARLLHTGLLLGVLLAVDSICYVK